MESYFKAAVCDLDKLLDEFERSTTDEYDCYRTPQNPYDSKHHSLSSVLDCLQCVYPTPKQQEDIISCTSSEKISLASCTGTSEVLLSYSQQNEKGVAGPDLLSTVDSGSLNEIQASNLGRCSVPVCDLVNDTGNLIHSVAAHEDAQKLQPDDLQYREGLIGFGTSCIPVHTCVSSAGCSSVSSTEQSEGDSMLRDSRHLKQEINHLTSKSNSYTTTQISGPCDDQHRTESVKSRGEFDQLEQTAGVNTPRVPVTSQNLDVYGPEDEKACKKLPCEPQDESACSAVSKEMHGRNGIEKVDTKNKNNVESMPSDQTKRPQLHESHKALPENSILPGPSCQTEAKVELEEKITEENVGSKELHNNEILNTVTSSLEDVQASLSCLPLPVSLCGSLVATDEKVNPLPQKEMAEVISNILTVHTGKSSTDLCSRESCENTDFHEQEVYTAKVDESVVEKSKDGEKYDTENVTDDSNSQQIKAFVSSFLEYEAEPYGVHIASDCSESMADFTFEDSVIKSDTLITDAELDAFLYGPSLQPSVLKSSGNDSLSVEADADEGYLTNVNNMDITEVSEEHMEAKPDKITSINNKVSLIANELHSAAKENVSHIQDVTESDSEALVSNVHGEGARPTWLLGLSQGAVGQRQLDSRDVLERKKQETSSLTLEAPLSDTNINMVGKNSDPVCSRESNSEAGGNQTSKNAASSKIPATLSWKQPVWVPDSEAPNCMNCRVKFTFTKRRHHCRACGKVFCGGCCKRKCKLQYMEKEARVCTGCYDYIKAQAFGKVTSADPDFSSITFCEPSADDSPAEEAQTSGASATPSSPVLVLRQPNIKELSPREEKRMDFVNPLPCDEIEGGRLSPTAHGLSPNAVKPEADDVSTNVNPEPVEEVHLVTRMAELHSSFSSRNAQQAIAGPVEVAHRFTLDTAETREEYSAAEAVSTSSSSVPQAAGVIFPSPSRYRQLCGVENCVSRAISLVPDGDQLPPLLLAASEKEKGPLVEPQPSHQQVMCLLAEGNPCPVTFILNANLLVNVKLMTYCSKKCWYFSTTGLHGLGQAEIIILLQCLPQEEIFPAKMLKLFIDIYKDAMNGKLIKNMGYITFTEKFLGTEDLGGFLFVSPTYEKFDDQILPDKPYLCGILIHKVEIPSVKAFPSRLMSSLGAESGAYPMPLLSVRERKPIFTEIGCTIFQKLTDFKNDRYTVDIIDNLLIHLEINRCCIKIPLRKYNEVMKVIDSSDEYVVIIGTNPSNEADSYLVSVQDEDGLYQSKTVSVTGCPRRVTSASFVVFKETTAPSAKCAVIEDGIIVDVTTETLQNLCKALRGKKDYKIICSETDTGEVEKCVDICWVEDEDQTVKGILSPVDGLPMEGTLSEKMFHNRNFEGTGKALNCTTVYYFVNNYELTHPILPVFADEVASGTSAALCPHVRSLKDSGMNKIGVRVSVAADTVEYTAGSEYCLLPQNYLNELDSTLVPVIHSRMLHPGSLPLKLELLFFIVEHLH